MKNLPKEKRDKLILIALATVAVAVGMWYGLIRAQKQKLASMAGKIVEQEQKVQSAHRLVSSAAELRAKGEAANARLQIIEQGMASGDMYSWIILTVNKFRANRRVEIPQFSREVATEVGVLPKFPYKAALFNVKGTAHYHDFGKFIAEFENAFPFLRVQNLEIEPAGETSANGNAGSEKLSFRMEVVALINPGNALN